MNWHNSTYIIIAVLVLLTSCATNNQFDKSAYENFKMYNLLQESIIDKENFQRGLLKKNLELESELNSLNTQIWLLSLNQDLEKQKEIIQEELPNPRDRIKDSQVRLYYSGVTLDIHGLQQNYLINSNSMDPLFDEGSTVLSIKPKKADEIDIGDIIVFKSAAGDTPIIHRVQDIVTDENGIYFTTKGDNNKEADPYKVRFNDVMAVVVAILY
jgi:hypothetical protein